MRIVHLFWGLEVGGTETMLVDIVNEQVLNAEVHIVVLSNRYDRSVLSSLNAGVGVTFVNRPVSSRNPWYLIKLHRVLRRLKPDILHSHAEYIIDAIPFRNAPIVATIHDTGLTLPASIRKHRGIFVISEAVKQDILARYPDLDLKVVYNGIHFSNVRHKEKYGGRPFRVVQIGRLVHEKKGQDILIKALSHVTEKLGEGAMNVDFIGEGESRGFLEGLADELGVGQWCRFLGLRSRQETYDLLPAYDLLVQPSRYEGFGLTVVEGMAAKVPVLVSDKEGPMEIVDNGRYGFFFRSGDFQDCADRMIEIMELSQDREMAGRTDEAYEYAKGRFDIRGTAKKYLEEYAKVLAGGTGKE
jgi:glycosyltransferase involved in cell wall biosynthesis